MYLPFSTDSKIASEIVSAFFNAEVTSLDPIVGKGSVNILFRACCADQEIIVRMSSPEDEVRGLAFYEKEVWCLKQAEQLGIPGPQVLALGLWGTRPYMLQSLVPGENGEDSLAERATLWKTLGNYAQRIHSLELNGFGGESLAEFHRGDARAAWQDFVDYNLLSLTSEDTLLRLNVYTLEQQDAIRSLFATLRETPFRFGLAHNDLALRNILVDDSGKVSLLDWGSAEVHIVPHYDMMEILRWNRPDETAFRAFLEGYGMSVADFNLLLPEIDAVALLKSFDLTRWAIDRCPERLSEIAIHARERVQLYFFP